MIPLTLKQKELLDYLKACETCPSFDEMKNALGLASKSGVHRLIQALEQRGFIRRIRDRARAIEVIEDPQFRADPSGYTREELAREAKRRGLVLGHIYRDAYGARKFEEIRAS